MVDPYYIIVLNIIIRNKLKSCVMKTKILSSIAFIMLGFFISCDSTNNDDSSPNIVSLLTTTDVANESKIDVAVDDVVIDGGGGGVVVFVIAIVVRGGNIRWIKSRRG